MFHNFLINENKKSQESEYNNTPTKDIMPQYTNINKEIKKRTNDLRKYFNIKNTIFKEMQSKQNSLMYKEYMSYLGKYFFGPNGVVTEKYKFLRDYYEALNLKIGLNNRIYAGTLDYFFLFPQNNSYSQRLNSTKQKLLSLSKNLAVASNQFDKINQKAKIKTKYIKDKKNFDYLNLKKSFSAGKNINNIKKININKRNLNKQFFTNRINNNSSSLLNKKNKSLRNNNNLININKIDSIHNNLFYLNINSDNQQSFNKTDRVFFDKENNKNNLDKKIILKKIHFNNNPKKKQFFLTPNNSLSNSQYGNSFLNNTYTLRNSNKSNANILKKKLSHIKSNNNIDNISSLSFSFPKNNNDKLSFEQKKIDESNFDFFINNIKDTLKEKINPILFLNTDSQKNLSYIKNHLKSKNYKKIKTIMKKNLMEILKDKEFFQNIKKLSTPKYIELPKYIRNKKKYFD